MQSASLMMAFGAKGVEMPTIAEGRKALDEILNVTPKQIAPDQRALREALGLSRAS